jgi:hypothetical protein
MKTFIVSAQETIYYTKFVQCESEQVLRKLLQTGDILFNMEDITDGDDFELLDIEEEGELT